MRHAHRENDKITSNIHEMGFVSQITLIWGKGMGKGAGRMGGGGQKVAMLNVLIMARLKTDYICL